MFLLAALPGIAQTLPETPLKVEFANVQILLNSDSRQKINAEVQRLLTPQSSYLNEKLERMQLYFPIIEKILEAENVPDDMKYLAVLESDLNANAVSPTQAVGFWQFKDFTAREMGLTLSGSQDDRKNLHLSTQAAARYLKKNNQIFKNWLSTTLSYTVGAGGAADLVPVEWSFASEVKLEKTQHPYLIKAIAHKLAYSHRLRQIPPTTKTLVEYPAKGKKISEIAEEVSLPESEILQNNPWLTASTVPTDKDYILLVKTDRAYAGQIAVHAKDLAKTDYISIGYPKLKRQTLVVTSTDQPVFYEINDKRGILAQPGDEVAQLARKGKISIFKFLSYNDMTDRDMVKEGTVYYLQKKHKKGPVPYHTLSDRQDLWEVAHIYGMRLKNLKKFNRISEGEEILRGRILWLQKKRPRKTPVQYNKNLVAPPEIFTTEPKESALTTAIAQEPDTDTASTTQYITHRVLENETLFSLAKKYGTTVEKLRELNHLGPSEGIKYNQRLLVPYSTEPEDDWVEDEQKEAKPVLMPPARKETPPATVPPARETPAVKIPVETAPVETAPAEKKVTTEKVSPAATGKHAVKRGETLFSIANRYGITVDELRRLNRMQPSETLKSGTTLIVPGGSTVLPATPAAVPANPVSTYTVQRGETLFSIANRYGLTVNELRDLNGISGNSIHSGQKLRVKSGGSPAPVQEVRYHTVKAGETLFSIANRYGVTVEDLKAWNNMKSNNLMAGKKIIVKK